MNTDWDYIQRSACLLIAAGALVLLLYSVLARGQSPDENGRLNAPTVTASQPSPAGVGVHLAPLPATSAPGDLVGLAPGSDTNSVALIAVRVGAGLQIRSGYLEAVPLYPTRTARVYGEDLTPQVDGSRSLFALSRPFLPGSEQVRVNGLASIRDRHYTVEGSPAAAIRFLGTPPGIAGGVPDTVAVDYDTTP